MSAYIGRFAPSPTGLLHFGSLVAALASYLDARHHQGLWLLRIDDVDQLRIVKDSASNILKALAIFGFKHDGIIRWQNQHLDDYQAALKTLNDKNLLYPCVCSRRDILKRSAFGIYTGICRNKTIDLNDSHAIRLKVQGKISFKDQIQGLYQQHLTDQLGDFIVKRKDGLIAYQLATVVDDSQQKITHIIRGTDLLESTPRQIYLQQQLKYSAIQYTHIPLVMSSNGHKLSKQNKDAPVCLDHPLKTLKKALQFLNQPLPENSQNIDQLLQQAAINWQIEKVKAA